MSSWVQREFSAAGSCWIHSIGKKNPKTLLHTQLPEKHAEACTRCLPGSPAHATPTSCSCMHCLQMLQTTPCQLIPTPAMLHMWGCNKKFNHHLEVQFTFKMHFHSALCPPTWITPGGCRKLAPVFHGDLLPSVFCWLQRCKKNAQTAPGRSYFYVVWATLCRWESNPHNPKCSLHPMPELETLQQKQCSFSSTGRAAL